VEIVAKATQIASAYYNAVKTRKFAITRPEAMLVIVGEFVERARGKLRAIIAELPAKNAQAADDLQTIIGEANASSWLLIVSICGHFLAFYEEFDEYGRADLTAKLEATRNDSLALRETHQQLFSVEIADPNNREKWLSSLSEERERRSAEHQLLRDYGIRMFEFEITH
jgi:hypothetical protein